MVIKALKKLTANQVINRGGEVAADKQNPKEWVNFTLRIPKYLLDEIEESLGKRIGLSKTAWMLESIQEKLKKDSPDVHT